MQNRETTKNVVKAIDIPRITWYNITKIRDERHLKRLKGIVIDMKTMTNAMMRKCEQAIKEFNDKYPNQYVHGYGFHHYGADYRIEEDDNGYKIFRCCRTSIEDTLIATIKK